MKTRLNRFTRLLAGCVLALLAGQAQATAPRITAAKMAEEAKPHLLAYEYPPLVTGNEAQPGAVVEVIRRALEAMGRSLDIEVVPSRSFAVARFSADATVVALIGDHWALGAAQRDAAAELPLMRLQGSYYVYRPAEGLARADGLQALAGKRYGAVPGEPPGTYEQAGLKVETGEPRLLFRKLQAQELDLVGAFRPAGDWMIARMFPNDREHFGILPFPAWESRYGIWFNPAHTPAGEWRTVIHDGIATIRANGQYGEILKRYGLDQEKLSP